MTPYQEELTGNLSEIMCSNEVELYDVYPTCSECLGVLYVYDTRKRTTLCMQKLWQNSSSKCEEYKNLEACLCIFGYGFMEICVCMNM